MQQDLEHVLVGRDEIAKRIAEVGREIYDDLLADDGVGDEVTLVPILTGSIIFVSDIIRHLPMRMQVGLISVTSYPGTATASQGARIDATLTNVPADLTGKHLLVMDDILDSGNTLRAVSEELSKRNPASLRTCVLLRKQRPEAMDFAVDYVAFDIPDEFVVGYGLDFDGYYRNLPDISTLKQSVIDNAQ